MSLKAATRMALALCCIGQAARADVVQPDGTTIPVDTMRIGGYLNGSANNDNINEGIDVRADAAVEPQIFSPLCQFSGKFIAKGGGANFAIGWYNVDNARPSNMPPKYVPVDLGANLNKAAQNSDIQILFPFSSSLPPENMRDLTAASIRMSPAYKGGYIGLALIPNPSGTGSNNATQYHYTEQRFNVQCTQCTKPGPWYSHLTYKSKKLANTFYLGFEDLDFKDLSGSQGINGNDLDYEDFLFRFTGLLCPGAGVPCDVTGNMGACRVGITDCDMTGKTVCRAQVQPGTQMEICDGVDNDCNGAADDKATCPMGKVCNRGRCVDPCGGGEFQCDVGLVCDQMVCIEPACVGKTCTDGKVCRAGQCVGPCDGVVCPQSQECRAGRCVDPCMGIPCGMNQVCLKGVCVVRCDCRTCATGESCAASGQCVETACVNQTCGAGTYCKGGQCVDACMGAKCPPGEECKMGQCMTAPVPPDMGTGPADMSGGAKDMATGGGSDGGGNTGGDGGGGGNGGGCSCRVGASSANGVAAVILALLLLALFNRRRLQRAYQRALKMR